MATYQKEMEEGPKDDDEISGPQLTQAHVSDLHRLLDLMVLSITVDGVRLSSLCFTMTFIIF